MDRLWTYLMPSKYTGYYPEFFTEIILPVTQQNIVEQIINFDIGFLRLGHTYKLYDLIEEGKNIDEVMAVYKQTKRLDFADPSYTRKLPPNYSLSEFAVLLFPENCGLNFNQKYLNFPFIDLPSYQKKTYDSL